jgi:hypothetical protein
MIHSKTIDETHGAATGARLAPTAGIARVVRCGICGDLAFEQARERLTEDEVAVLYTCPPCRWHHTRHFLTNPRD